MKPNSKTTDHELLELSAKSAGYAIEWREWYTSRIAEFGTIKHEKKEGFRLNGKQWDPLTDDGDALRLAVKLGIRILHPCIESTTGYPNAVRAGTFDCGEAEEMYDDHGGDPYAATRRAIVRAAADIGKDMK